MMLVGRAGQSPNSPRARLYEMDGPEPEGFATAS